MHRKWRIIYWFMAILVFAVGSTTAVLYSQGYKLDISQKTLTKTGSIYLETEPRGAFVYLDDQKMKNQTPELINRLSPKNYSIRIKKNGYFDWQKNISVRASEAVDFDQIILFKSDTSPGLINKNTYEPKFISEGMAVYYKIEDNINKIYSFNLDQEELIYENDTAQDIKILNPGLEQTNKIIIQSDINNTVNYLVVNINDKEAVNINELLLSTLGTSLVNLGDSKIKFGKNDNQIFLTLNKQIYLLNLGSSQLKEVLPSQENILDFFVMENDVYYIIKQDNQNILKVTNYLETSAVPQIISAIDKSSSYTFNTENPEYAVLIIPETEKMMIMNRQSNSLSIEYLEQKVKGVNWSADNKNLLYFNDFEIWQYDFEKDTKELIVRQSEVINDIAWHPEMLHVVYNQNNLIKIAELEERFGRHFTELVKSGANQILINKKGDTVFWFSLNSDGYNFYKQEIR